MAVRAFEKVVSEIPDAVLLFAGKAYDDGGAYKNLVKKAIKRAKLEEHIKFLNSRDDVVDLYNLCDLTILPSFHEGLPNVVLESMACGTPVIVTDVSDNARVVIDGSTGHVVPSDDADMLADRIVSLAKNENQRSAFSSASRKKAVEDFSLEVMAKRAESIYLSHLRNKGACSAPETLHNQLSISNQSMHICFVELNSSTDMGQRFG